MSELSGFADGLTVAPQLTTGKYLTSKELDNLQTSVNTCGIQSCPGFGYQEFPVYFLSAESGSGTAHACTESYQPLANRELTNCQLKLKRIRRSRFRHNCGT